MNGLTDQQRVWASNSLWEEAKRFRRKAMSLRKRFKAGTEVGDLWTPPALAVAAIYEDAAAFINERIESLPRKGD